MLQALDGQHETGNVLFPDVVACSDKEENLPRPARRIQRFKDFLGTSKEPMVKVFRQPRVRVSGCSLRFSE